MTDEQKEYKRQYYLTHKEEIEKDFIREIQPKYNVLKYKG